MDTEEEKQHRSRDAFRTAVFARERGRCALCDRQAQDAHHIIERRLWDDGGYHLENGIALCTEHHLAAEMTLVSCEDLRLAAGIQKVILPPHLEADCRWDKWGNQILPDGRRVRGDLFNDESVQKVLQEGGVLQQFTHYWKYPRTPHLPWSPGSAHNRNDLILRSTDHFCRQEVVVTEKMDGENTTMYPDHIHARSVDGRPHPSQTWVRNLHGKIAHDIPVGWRICGENLYAKHAIHYQDLLSYFQVFAVYDNRNICLSWDETDVWARLLGMRTVQVLYRGLWDEGAIRAVFPETGDAPHQEGYVVRVMGSFSYQNHRRSVAKYVREGHVVDTNHWRSRPLVRNKTKTAPDHERT